MSFLRFWSRKGRVVSKTHVMEADWSRSEELRTDRLGPGPEDIQEDDESSNDPWRPKRTLT